MAIKSYKLGPGTLKLDAAGTLDVSCQVTACVLTPKPNVKTIDAIPVLCGEEVPEEEEVTYEYTLSGKFLQDIDAAGVVDWSWTNKGLTKAFEFIPNTVKARKVTGSIRVDPLAIGGDEMKRRPQSDFEWKATAPLFTAV